MSTEDQKEIIVGMGKFVDQVSLFYGGKDNIPGEILHGIEIVLRTIDYMARKAYEDEINRAS